MADRAYEELLSLLHRLASESAVGSQDWIQLARLYQSTGQLAESTAGRPNGPALVDSLLPAIVDRSSGGVSAEIGTGDAATLTNVLEQLRAAVQAPVFIPNKSTNASTGGDTANGGALSAVEKVASTLFGGVFGLSPLITGLAGLFQGSAEEPPPLVKFAMPRPVDEAAVLDRGNRVTEGTYGEDGLMRQPGRSSSTQIQLTVQALDSQSFLDRRNDIAQAVKEAMLYSHPLNDVVSDL